MWASFFCFCFIFFQGLSEPEENDPDQKFDRYMPTVVYPNSDANNANNNVDNPDGLVSIGMFSKATSQNISIAVADYYVHSIYLFSSIHTMRSSMTQWVRSLTLVRKVPGSIPNRAPKFVSVAAPLLHQNCRALHSR